MNHFRPARTPGRPQRHVRKGRKTPATLSGSQPRGSGHLPDPANDLIYGLHAVAAAINNGTRKLVHLWVTENGLARLKVSLENNRMQAEIVHPRLLDHLLCGQDAVHQGVLLEARPLQQPRLDQISHKGIIVILDQVTDPHNVGAILRSCAAFAATALVTTARHAPQESGAFFKSASGAAEHVPLVRVTNLGRAIAELKGYGVCVIGLDSEAGISLEASELKQPIALVLGAEGKGLRAKTRQLCDHLLKLDMPGAIRSLNVSVAAAIALYALRTKPGAWGARRDVADLNDDQ